MKDEPRVAPAEVALTDINAAALLLASGASVLLRIEPTADPRRQSFVLVGDPHAARALLEEFATGRVRVDLEAFLSSQRLLRDRVYRWDRLRRR